MKRDNTGRFAPKPKTDWIDALTAEELELLNEQLPIVIRFKEVNPSTEDEAGNYLAACSLVHWLSRIGMLRQGHPACRCEACTDVEASLAESEREEADQARAEIRMHREEARERWQQERRHKAPIVEAPAHLAEPLDPDEMIQVISANGLITVRRSDLEEL